MKAPLPLLLAGLTLAACEKKEAPATPTPAPVAQRPSDDWMHRPGALDRNGSQGAPLNHRPGDDPKNWMYAPSILDRRAKNQGNQHATPVPGGTALDQPPTRDGHSR